jgi:hypothetical protein
MDLLACDRILGIGAESGSREVDHFIAANPLRLWLSLSYRNAAEQREDPTRP